MIEELTSNDASFCKTTVKFGNGLYVLFDITLSFYQIIQWLLVGDYTEQNNEISHATE